MIMSRGPDTRKENLGGIRKNAIDALHNAVTPTPALLPQTRRTAAVSVIAVAINANNTMMVRYNTVWRPLLSRRIGDQGKSMEPRQAAERPDRVLRVLQSKEEARAFYNKISAVYDILAEHSEGPMRQLGIEKLRLKRGEPRT
jgi:hypothetical protein